MENVLALSYIGMRYMSFYDLLETQLEMFIFKCYFPKCFKSL